jgi:hypothetical protein
MEVRGLPGRTQKTLSKKKKKVWGQRGIAQVVERLSNKHKALRSKPSIAKNK